MTKKFLIIDTSHLLHRTRHTTRGDIWTQVGLSLHIIFNSIRKCWREFDADHVVFCLEGKSWRSSIYEPYKQNRKARRLLKSTQEIEEDEIFFAGVNEFIQFIQKRTNCTVLQNPICEADDLIARWVQYHPNDDHIIVSGDTDFIQLVDKNVCIYDGIRDVTIKHDGVYNNYGNKVEFNVKSDGKLKILKEDKTFQAKDNWVEWALFLKLIRGDSGDNIFSSYPKVRTVELEKAFLDKEVKGYDWNNLMLTRWTDHNNKDHRVRDCYERNIVLIDLTKQPDPIKDTMDDTIKEAIAIEKKGQIGLHLLKFAGKYELNKIAEYPQNYTDFLSSSY